MIRSLLSWFIRVVGFNVPKALRWPHSGANRSPKVWELEEVVLDVLEDGLSNSLGKG